MKGWLIYDRKGRARNAWFIKRLTDCAEREGLFLTLIPAEELNYGVDGDSAAFYLRGERLDPPAFALVRTIDPLLSETLEAAGVRVYNSARVSAVCNDKRRTHTFAASLGIRTAKTFFLEKNAFDPGRYTYPLILKSAAGHGGNEVFWLHDADEACRAVCSLDAPGILLQEPVTPGRDVRVYLLGGRILAAVRRSSDVDFRSNYSLGGEAALFSPDEEMKEIVSKIAETLLPTFVGVDFVFDREGRPLLNEIEDVVGSRMLYAVAGIDAAQLLIREIASGLSSR